MAYNAADPTAGAAGDQDPYNYQRNQASQRAAGQQRANYDALQRRFANNGGMNSGAAIQAEQNADRGVQEDLENTQGAIGSEEGQNAIKFKQAQDMQSGQNAFAAGQAREARAQDESQFGRKLTEQQSEFNQEIPLKKQQLDQEAKQQQMDEEATLFNENMAQWSQKHSGGLLGAGGFLGSGIGI